MSQTEEARDEQPGIEHHRFSKDGLREARDTFEEAVVSEDWEAAYDATVEMRAILKRLGPRWEWTDEGPRGGDE
jgi:hypothetical protein